MNAYSRNWMRKSFTGFLVFLFCLSAMQAFSAQDEGAGTVIAARRQAWADRAREKSVLASKNPVYAGDLLVTNEVGRLQVLFRDDSVFMMAPDSRAKVTEYLYGETGNNRFNLDLARGMTRIISGRITEEGGVIEVQTSKALVGIHGTDVLISAGDDDVLVAVRETKGKRPVEVCPNGVSAGSCLPLGANQGLILSGSGIRPMTPAETRDFMRNGGLQAGGVQPPATGGPGGNPPQAPGLLAGIPDAPGNGLPLPGVLQDMLPETSFAAANAEVVYSGSFIEGWAEEWVMESGGYRLTVGNLLEDPRITGVHVFANLAFLVSDEEARGSISMSARGSNLGSFDPEGFFLLENPGPTVVNLPGVQADSYSSMVSGQLPEGLSGGALRSMDWSIENGNNPEFARFYDSHDP